MGSWMSAAGSAVGGGGGGGMSSGNMAGLMGGGGGGSIKDLRTKGLESYKDMSQGDPQGLMGAVLQNQGGSQQNMKFQQQQDAMKRQQQQRGMDPRMQGLMMRGMGR